jgi:hypothetical protein
MVLQREVLAKQREVKLLADLLADSQQRLMGHFFRAQADDAFARSEDPAQLEQQLQIASSALVMLEGDVAAVDLNERRELEKAAVKQRESQAVIRAAATAALAQAVDGLHRLLRALGWHPVDAMDSSSGNPQTSGADGGPTGVAGMGGRVWSVGGEEDGTDFVGLRFEEDVGAAQVVLGALLSMPRVPFDRVVVEQCCAALLASCQQLDSVYGQVDANDCFRRALEWANGNLTWLVGTVRFNAIAWLDTCQKLDGNACKEELAEGLVEGRRLGCELLRASHSMVSAVRGCHASRPESTDGVQAAFQSLLQLRGELGHEEARMRAWPSVARQLGHAGTFALHVAYVGVRLAEAAIPRHEILEGMRAAASRLLGPDPLQGVNEVEELRDALAQLNMLAFSYSESCSRPLLPAALDCTLNPGSIVHGAAAMIKRSGETGIAASLLLKHAWEGVSVLCSAVLNRAADFSPVCLQALSRFVDGLRVLAEASAEMESPSAHAVVLQSVLGTPSVDSLLDSWQSARHFLLSRHPSLAQCCDCVFARVGAALSELLRMIVHVLHSVFQGDLARIPFLLDTGHAEVLLVSAGSSSVAPAWRLLRLANLRHVDKLVVALCDCETARAVGLRRDTARAWFQDLALVADMLEHGMSNALQTLVALHQGFPDAVSIRQVVSSLSQLMASVVSVMQGEAPSPHDAARRAIAFSTAQSLLDYEEVARSKEASQGLLLALEKRLLALQLDVIQPMRTLAVECIDACRLWRNRGQALLGARQRRNHLEWVASRATATPAARSRALSNLDNARAQFQVPARRLLCSRLSMGACALRALFWQAEPHFFGLCTVMLFRCSFVACCGPCTCQASILGIQGEVNRVLVASQHAVLLATRLRVSSEGGAEKSVLSGTRGVPLWQHACCSAEADIADVVNQLFQRVKERRLVTPEFAVEVPVSDYLEPQLGYVVSLDRVTIAGPGRRRDTTSPTVTCHLALLGVAKQVLSETSPLTCAVSSAIQVRLFSGDLPPARGVRWLRVVYNVDGLSPLPEFYDLDVEACRTSGALSATLTMAAASVTLHVSVRRVPYRYQPLTVPEVKSGAGGTTVPALLAAVANLQALWRLLEPRLRAVAMTVAEVSAVERLKDTVASMFATNKDPSPAARERDALAWTSSALYQDVEAVRTLLGQGLELLDAVQNALSLPTITGSGIARVQAVVAACDGLTGVLLPQLCSELLDHLPVLADRVAQQCLKSYQYEEADGGAITGDIAENTLAHFGRPMPSVATTSMRVALADVLRQLLRFDQLLTASLGPCAAVCAALRLTVGIACAPDAAAMEPLALQVRRVALGAGAVCCLGRNTGGDGAGHQDWEQD